GRFRSSRTGTGSTSSCPTAVSFFASTGRHARFSRDWSAGVCSSDLAIPPGALVVQCERNPYRPTLRWVRVQPEVGRQRQLPRGGSTVRVPHEQEFTLPRADQHEIPVAILSIVDNQ